MFYASAEKPKMVDIIKIETQKQSQFRAFLAYGRLIHASAEYMQDQNLRYHVYLGPKAHFWTTPWLSLTTGAFKLQDLLEEMFGTNIVSSSEEEVPLDIEVVQEQQNDVIWISNNKGSPVTRTVCF